MGPPSVPLNRSAIPANEGNMNCGIAMQQQSSGQRVKTLEMLRATRQLVRQKKASGIPYASARRGDSSGPDVQSPSPSAQAICSPTTSINTEAHDIKLQLERSSVRERELREKVSGLTTEVQQLRQQLQEQKELASSRERALEDSVTRFEVERKDFEAKLLERCRAEGSETQQTSELTIELQRCQRQLEQERQAMVTRERSLQDTVTRLETDRKNMEAKLVERSSAQGEDMQVSKLTVELEQFRQQLQHEREVASTRERALEDRATRCENQRRDLELKLQERSASQDAELQVSKLTVEVQILQQQLQQEREARSGRERQLEDRATRLENERMDLEAVLAERIAAQSAEMEAELKLRLGPLQAQIESLMRELDIVRRDRRQRVTELLGRSAAVESSTVVASVVPADADTNVEVSNLTDELQRLRQQLRHEREVASTRERALEDRATRSENELKDLELKLQEQSAAQDAELQVSKLNMEVQILQQQLQQEREARFSRERQSEDPATRFSAAEASMVAAPVVRAEAGIIPAAPMQVSPPSDDFFGFFSTPVPPVASSGTPDVSSLF